MAFLLDTHIWLWSLLEPSRLSAKALEPLKTAGVDLHLSTVSAWEVVLLSERGRLALQSEASNWLQTAMAESPVAEIPLTLDVVLASASIRLPHRDPADRLIAGSAKAYDLTLITADRRLIDCPDIDILAA